MAGQKKKQKKKNNTFFNFLVNFQKYSFINFIFILLDSLIICLSIDI